jgi:hypothetical protein
MLGSWREAITSHQDPSRLSQLPSVATFKLPSVAPFAEIDVVGPCENAPATTAARAASTMRAATAKILRDNGTDIDFPVHSMMQSVVD